VEKTKLTTSAIVYYHLPYSLETAVLKFMKLCQLKNYFMLRVSGTTIIFWKLKHLSKRINTEYFVMSSECSIVSHWMTFHLQF